jgi:hypothetical protein
VEHLGELKTGSRVEVVIDGVPYVAQIATKGIEPGDLKNRTEVRVQLVGTYQFRTVPIEDIFSAVAA